MKNVLTYIFLMCFGTLTIVAQSTEPAKKGKRAEHGKLVKEFKESLSESQIAQFESLKEIKKKNKAEKEASFSQDQLAIVKNKELSRKEKREKLKPTLTEQQKGMMKNHKEALKAEREKFKSTLNDEQLALYEKMGKRRGRHGKHHKEGKSKE